MSRPRPSLLSQAKLQQCLSASPRPFPIPPISRRLNPLASLIMIPKALFLSFFAFQLPDQLWWGSLRHSHQAWGTREAARHDVVALPHSTAVGSHLPSSIVLAVREDAALTMSIVQPQDNRSDKDGVAFEILRLNYTYILVCPFPLFLLSCSSIIPGSLFQ